MDIFESLENLGVSEECFEDILNIVEEYINENKPIIRNKLFTGSNGPEYEVTSSADDATVKTKVNANSASDAEKIVNKIEGGPARAHKVLVKGNEQRTAEEISKALNNGKRKVSGFVVSRNKKGNITGSGVSEECYTDILNIIESIINETKKESKEKRDKWMADQMSKEPVFSERSGGWVKKTAKQLLAGKKSDFENTSKAWKNYNKNEKNIKQLNDKYTKAIDAYYQGDGSWRDKYNTKNELEDARKKAIPLYKKALKASDKYDAPSSRQIWQKARDKNKYGDPLENRAAGKRLVKKGYKSPEDDVFIPIEYSNVGAKIPKPKN